ncbi:MAG: hypothetical protein WBM69_22655 [Desulfobacterales bacterium]
MYNNFRGRKGKKRNLEPQKTSSFWYPLAKAATLGLLGRDEEGKQFAENLLKLKLNFPSKGRFLIGHYIKFEEIVERVLEGLNKVGLSIE